MKEKRFCEYCGKEIIDRHSKRFCSRACYNKAHETEHYEKYLADNSIAYGVRNMQCYKKFFLEEQNHKCAICGCDDS